MTVVERFQLELKFIEDYQAVLDADILDLRREEAELHGRLGSATTYHAKLEVRRLRTQRALKAAQVDAQVQAGTG
jgi:hypothetical protein